MKTEEEIRARVEELEKWLHHNQLQVPSLAWDAYELKILNWVLNKDND